VERRKKKRGQHVNDGSGGKKSLTKLRRSTSSDGRVQWKLRDD